MTKPQSPTNPPPQSSPPTPSTKDPQTGDGEYHLSRREAAAGAPANESVTGEEDPGAGLEFLVRK